MTASFIYSLLASTRKPLLVMMLLMPGVVQAQQKDLTPNPSPKGEGNMAGVLKGKVKDSTYNFMLTSATVAVYKAADSMLLQFSIPNNFGEFTITPLPVAVPLRLIITHTGYKPFVKNFRLGKEAPIKDIGLLYMHQHIDEDGNMLEEVIVKAVPPVRMNGDTLEFNADAFKMDANATGEDWMRILPGLTIWGDGEITFNGKKIQSLLVDGKPFMGGETSVATQNLPKEALEKLQIYQQRDEKNPLDSTMYANLKLKDDKKMGYFGKVSGGYGITPVRNTPLSLGEGLGVRSSTGAEGALYSADATLSGFNKKLQINTAGAINNINKLASNIDVLMRNSSYKGEGLNLDYQSNFNMRGLNRPLAAGTKLQYDFIPDPKYRRQSRLNADYFINDNQTQVNNNTLSDNYLSGDTILSRNAISRSQNYSTDQRFAARYGLSTERMSLNVNTALTSNTDDNNSTSRTTREKTGVGLIGIGASENTGQFRKKGWMAGVDYTNREVFGYRNEKRIPSEFTLGYQFKADESDGQSRSYTKYTSPINEANNKEFDRLYEQRDMQSAQHQFKARYPGLRRLIFNKRRFGGINMDLSGNYTIDKDTYTDRVLDKDPATGDYVLNNYLTNERHAQTQNFVPALQFSKTFYKGLTNRYNKWVTLTADIKKQFFAMQHSATQQVQNFSYRYAEWIPAASAEYYNHQYGSYEMRYNLNYTTGVNYPGVNNIAPLVDSSNLWYIPKGNPFIQPQRRQELAFKYNFTTRKPKNPLVIDLRAGVGKTNDNITDSTLYNNEGVRTVYAVNVDGNRFVNGGIGVKKSIELNKKKTTLEAGLRYDITESKDPEYINSLLNTSKNINQNISANISYRYKDLLNLKAEQHFRYYNSEQQGFNNSRFKSANQFTRFLGTLQIPKDLTWATNITYNKSGSNNAAAVYFTIWNASLTYRFLKGNQGEVKFSALDLLRQNKGIVNTSKGNTQTFTTSNVLQQYYMLTLSYYPRKFGKRVK